MRCAWWAVLWTLAACTGDGPEDTDGPTEAPRCFPEADATGPPDTGDTGGDTGGEEVIRHHFPSTCGTLLEGVGPGCGTATDATLTLDGVAQELAWSCTGGVLLEDTQGNVFEGVHFSMVPETSCEPMVTVAVIDSVRYGDPPVSSSLADTLCEGSALHNIGAVITTSEACLVLPDPATGTFHVEHLDARTGWGGWLEADFVDEGGGTVHARLDYEIGAPRVSGNYQALYDDLCVAAE